MTLSPLVIHHPNHPIYVNRKSIGETKLKLVLTVMNHLKPNGWNPKIEKRSGIHKITQILRCITCENPKEPHNMMNWFQTESSSLCCTKLQSQNEITNNKHSQ